MLIVIIVVNKEEELDPIKQQALEIREKLLSIIRREDRTDADCKVLFTITSNTTHLLLKRLFPMAGAEEEVTQEIISTDMYRKIKNQVVLKAPQSTLKEIHLTKTGNIIITGEMGI